MLRNYIAQQSIRKYRCNKLRSWLEQFGTFPLKRHYPSVEEIHYSTLRVGFGNGGDEKTEGLSLLASIRG